MTVAEEVGERESLTLRLLMGGGPCGSVGSEGFCGGGRQVATLWGLELSSLPGMPRAQGGKISATSDVHGG